jgi:hypothetical protein
MGFTVAGPGDLLASGHPDLRHESLQVHGKPPLLGLVASSDGVRSKPLSLLGDVDFHSLVTAHDQVYGLDSQTGALMVSSDRRTWDVRAEGLPFTDIAVDPTDPDTLLGAGSATVAASVDGGRSWRPVCRQQLQYLSCNESGLVRHLSRRRRRDVDRRGRDMAPRQCAERHATRAVGHRRQVFVANEDGIIASDDGGATFTMMDLTAAG